MAPGGGRTLNRDFKDVRRHAYGGAGQPFSGWVGLGIGLGLGLAVALGVHLYDRRQGTPMAEPVPATAKAPASASASDESMAAGPVGVPPSPDLDFYDVLPKQEVDVSDAAQPRGGGATRTPLPTGDAVLQAGSFKQSTEAEKLVAQLALSGIDAKIQRASVDDETWYRVRIGPIATVEDLRNVQAKLREADITAAPVTSQEEAPLP
ncbi:MAG: SPOR domain-containing protein [Steroidobacteraceae bacterium]